MHPTRNVTANFITSWHRSIRQRLYILDASNSVASIELTESEMGAPFHIEALIDAVTQTRLLY